MERLKVKLEKLISNKGGISPDIALNTMLDFFSRHKADHTSNDPEDDMLLFQYGTYDWDGTGKEFELDFTRQIITQDEEGFHQIRLTLFFNAADFEEIQEWNKWSGDMPTLDNWKTEVRNSEGFVKAKLTQPRKIEVQLTRI